MKTSMQQLLTTLQFPQEVLRLRSVKQLSQKALALTIQMDQSQLSGIERGTRPPPTDVALDRIAGALALAPNQRTNLEWAARHDRCVRFVMECSDSMDDVQLVSQVLIAAHELTTEQRLGLVNYLKSVRSAAQQLSQLQGQGHPPRGDGMT